MKKILKITTLSILIIINLIFCFYLIYSNTYFSKIIAKNNAVSLVGNSFITPNENGTFTLIYFYDEQSLQVDKLEEVKAFAANQDVVDILNFKEFNVDGIDIDKYLIYTTLTKNSGSNSILLLNKSGYTVLSFSPNEDISHILNELKNTLKNYI